MAKFGRGVGPYYRAITLFEASMLTMLTKYKYFGVAPVSVGLH